MHKLIAALAVVSTLGLATSAFAGPVQLSDTQLDVVTAGSSHAFGAAGGIAGGSVGSGVLSIGIAHTNGNSAIAAAGVLAVGIGRNSFAAGGVIVAASSSNSAIP